MMKACQFIIIYQLLYSNILAQQYEFQIRDEISSPIDGSSLFHHVAQWAQFSDHLTGSNSDHATTEWLREKLLQAGYTVRFQELVIPLFDFENAELKVNNEELQCFPIWTPVNTGEVPVSGPLVLFDGDPATDYSGKLVFFEVDELRMSQFELALKAVKAGAKGLIINYPHPTGVLGTVNSPQPDRPLPIPMVLVGNQHSDRLRKEAVKNSKTSIKIRGHFNAQAKARNVIGTLDNGYDKWVIISTPASGWFNCVGERGTGVAILLGLAEWAAQQVFEVNWMICITTGHELGHAGIKRLMNSNVLPVPEATVAFISLGASVAARDWQRTNSSWEPLPELTKQVRLIVSPKFSNYVNSAFTNIYEPEITEQPEGGELRNVMEQKYPVIGLFGGHFWFHTSEDNLKTTDPQLLQSVAKSLSSVLTQYLTNN